MIDEAELKESFKSLPFKDMLSFYGIELQSHASTILGLALFIFAVVQAWGPLVSGTSPSKYLILLFSAIVGVMGAGIVYQLLRLYVFGKLASALMSASLMVFKESMNHFDAQIGNYYQKNPGSFGELSSFTKLNIFTDRMFQLNCGPLLALRIFMVGKRGVRRSFWILIAGFEAWFALFYAVIFGGFDWRFLSWFVPLSFLVIWAVHQVSVKWILEWLNGRGLKMVEKQKPPRSESRRP